jgi:hypothetical protein
MCRGDSVFNVYFCHAAIVLAGVSGLAHGLTFLGNPFISRLPVSGKFDSSQ